MHEVLVNRLGGLSLPRKSVVRLTDRPDMTLDIYRGRKTTIQQQQQHKSWWITVFVRINSKVTVMNVVLGIYMDRSDWFKNSVILWTIRNFTCIFGQDTKTKTEIVSKNDQEKNMILLLISR